MMKKLIFTTIAIVVVFVAIAFIFVYNNNANALCKQAEKSEKMGDEQKTFDLYLKAASKGAPKAQFKIAMIYAQKGDIKTGLVWFNKAALQDYVEAQNILGWYYSQAEKDFIKAAYWYEKAAQTGDMESQYNLGKLLYEKKGSVDDMLKGEEWLEKAAQQGCIQAQFELGAIYTDEDSVLFNERKGMSWYEKCVSTGIEKNYLNIKNYDDNLSLFIQNDIQWFEFCFNFMCNTLIKYYSNNNSQFRDEKKVFYYQEIQKRKQ